MHGDRSAPEAVSVDAALADVDRDGEGVTKGDGSEEHLDADQKVLENNQCYHKNAVIFQTGSQNINSDFM